MRVFLEYSLYLFARWGYESAARRPIGDRHETGPTDTGTPQGLRFAVDDQLRTFRGLVQNDLLEVPVWLEAQTVEYIKECDTDNLVVHLDSYHMNIEENNFRDPVFDAGELLGYVHIGENHRGYLGQGHIDFPELFKALVDANYDGVITFESFSSKVVDDDLTTTLRIWRNMWENSMDLAVQARRYMGEEMAKAGAK
jgi:hypothetical protein